jgi:hypothetical protein
LWKIPKSRDFWTSLTGVGGDLGQTFPVGEYLPSHEPQNLGNFGVFEGNLAISGQIWAILV